MQIYVHRYNQQLGPFTEAELKAQLASGAISLQDQAWWQGQANWVPLAQTPFAGIPAPGTPPIPGAMPGAMPMPGFPSTVPKTSNYAIWSLVCACLSLICGIFSAIPAIILGHLGLAEIKKDPSVKGRGMALSGMIIGYVMLALIPLAIVVLILLGNQVKTTFNLYNNQGPAAQTQSSQDDSDSNQSTNSADQLTNTAPSSDNTTNSPPTVTP